MVTAGIPGGIYGALLSQDFWNETDLMKDESMSTMSTCFQQSDPFTIGYLSMQEKLIQQINIQAFHGSLFPVSFLRTTNDSHCFLHDDPVI